MSYLQHLITVLYTACDLILSLSSFWSKCSSNHPAVWWMRGLVFIFVVWCWQTSDCWLIDSTMAGPAGHQWGAAGGQIFAVSHQGGVRGVGGEGAFVRCCYNTSDWINCPGCCFLLTLARPAVQGHHFSSLLSTQIYKFPGDRREAGRRESLREDKVLNVIRMSSVR